MVKKQRQKTVPMRQPRRAEQLLGRAAELEDLYQMLQPGRVVTLLGEPGIGKRSLAAEAVARLAPAGKPPALFPDGIVTLSCCDHPDDAYLLSSFARILGVPAYPDLRGAVRTALADKRMLIVLEDVQVLADEVYETAQLLPPAAAASTQAWQAEDAPDAFPRLLDVLCGPRTCVLLTSTDPARTAGEVMPLGPLSAEDAKLLLVFYSDSEDVFEQEDSELDGLLADLGGVPLALVLAGAWLGLEDRTPAECRAALAPAGLSSLPPPARGAAAIAAIFDLCCAGMGDAERLCLYVAACLAVAPIPLFVLGEMIQMAPEAGMEVFANLLDYGVLVSAGEQLEFRHYLLHDLAAGLPGPVGEALVDQVQTMVDALIDFAALGADDGPTVDALQHLHPHILALQSRLVRVEAWVPALQLAVGTYPYFLVPQDWYAQLELIAMAAAAVEDSGEAAAVGQVAMAYGTTYTQLGEDDAAAHEYARAIEAAEAGEDEGLLLMALEAYTAACAATGNMAAAQHSAERLLQRLEGQDQADLDPGALTSMIAAFLQGETMAGNLDRVIALCERGLQRAEQECDREGRYQFLMNLGAAFGSAQEHVRAMPYFEQAVEAARELRDRECEALALVALGVTYESSGDAKRGMRTLEKALDVAKRSKVPDAILTATWQLARTLEQQGQLSPALRHYEACRSLVGGDASSVDPTPEEIAERIDALRQALGRAF